MEINVISSITIYARMAFPLVLPMAEILSGMGVPDESRVIQ
jgi:hypothetical protein